MVAHCNFKQCSFFFTSFIFFFFLVYMCLFLSCSSYIFLTLFVADLCHFGTQHSKSVRSIQTHCFWKITFKTSMWIQFVSTVNKYCRNLMARCHIRLCIWSFSGFFKIVQLCCQHYSNHLCGRINFDVG